ncbi:efflux RND transporter periplasmic adaptor subunit [Actinoplanes sp. NPDC023714]|uniref:efflux RND transporter periplasmic adaptor subunit n=1 Tax=Actinoplanes sp. NPDC023714 TaxID=3154322 RepID=UPI003411E7D3
MSRRPRIVIIAVLVLPFLTAASCDDEPSGIRVGRATVGTVEEVVEAPGTVTARSAATLTAPAAGTIAELRVSSGDRVDEGDLLAVIDSPELTQRRDAAEEALDQAAPVPVASNYAEVSHGTDERAGKAFAHASESAGKIGDPELRKAFQQQIAAAEAQYREASEAAAAAVRSVQRGVASLSRAVGALSAAQRLQAEQSYALADAAVEALSLRAPVSGVVQWGGPRPAAGPDVSALLAGGAAGAGAVPAAQAGVDSALPVGAYVTAGTPILTVVDTGELGLTADVDETDMLLVKAGIAAEVELDAAPGVAYAATVRSSDLLPTTSARGGVSYRVRLELAPADPRPLPGMSAIVRLTVRQAEDVVTVPASAVISVDGRDTVWAVRGGRFEAVPVTLGVQGDETVQIASGVEAGEAIVVSGADQVEAGDEAP